MNKPRFFTLAAMVFCAAAFRFLPHPPNFSPVAAMALFAGARFSSRLPAFVLPLSAMLLSDLVLGFHSLMPVVYGCFAVIVALGFTLRENSAPMKTAAIAVAGSITFFAVTNFAVWAASKSYPGTITGLMACYAAAIPFFWNTLAGDLFFVAILFGSFHLAELKIPALRIVPANSFTTAV